MKERWLQLRQGTFSIALISLFLGLLVSALIMALGGYNPLSAYVHMVKGIFGSPYLLGETLRQITPLILTGLAASFAFRTGIFNIGAEGQFMVGQLAAVAVGILMPLPAFLHIPLAVGAAVLAGGLWAAIAGYLKAKRGVHEVISTIMMNWIALFLCNYLIREFLKGRTERTESILPTASLSSERLSQWFDGARVHYGIFLALAAAVLVYFILWKTTLGFQLRAVGNNLYASEYAGINVKRNVVLSMFISGALAGLAGASEGLGVYGYMAISSGFPGYGFDGIAVALLGANTSIGIILAGILFGGMTFGAKGMQMSADVPYEIVRIVIALVIFFVASGHFVRQMTDWVKARVVRNPKGGESHGSAS
jgi:simple sugar transport system permease protein